MRITTLAAAVAAVTLGAAAEASTYTVEQQTTAGGAYAAIGTITAFDGGANTAAQFYNYAGASYNGDDFGGPAAAAGDALLFLVEASDGLSLFLVLDAPGGGGGSARTTWDLTGDTFASLRADDGGEVRLTNGDTRVTTTGAGDDEFDWVNCCTDGFAAAGLDGDWTLEGGFAATSGLSGFRALGPNSDLALSLEAGRQVRITAAPIPLPAAAPMALAALAALGVIGRRRAR